MSCRASRNRGTTRRAPTPNARTRCSIARARSSCASSIRPTIASRRKSCGACHMDIMQASVRSLHSTATMFWGGAAYNNGILDFKQYILGEAYGRNGEAIILKGPKIPDHLVDAAAIASIVPQIYPLPNWESLKPGDIFRVFERGGRNIANLFPETGLPNANGQLQRIEEPGRPDFRQSNRGPGHRRAHFGAGDQHHQDAPQRSELVVHRHQRSARRLSPFRLRFLPRRVRERSRSAALRRLRQVRARGPHADRRSDDQQDRVGPSADAHAYALGADEPMHDLPHAPAEHVPEHVPRLHHVGLRVRRAAHVAREAAVSGLGEDPRRARPQPGSRGDARQVGRREFPEERVRAQSADEGHAVRRLSRPRLEFPRGVQARSQRQSARCRRQRRQRRRSAEVQEVGAPVIDSRRRRHAMRRLSLLAGQPRQRLHL